MSDDLHFYMGRCHTIRPKKELSRVSKKGGYSIMLKHHIFPDENTHFYYENPIGWHIFIHDQRENFTGIS